MRIKRILAMGIIALMILGNSHLLYAADPLQTEKTVDVRVHIVPTFGFQIWETQYVQDLYPFGLDPNDSSREGAQFGNINMYVTTNYRVPWSIQAACAGVVKGGQTGYGQTGYGEVPLIITTFSGNSQKPLTGTVVENKQLTASSQNIYNSGANETAVQGIELAGIFQVKPGVTLSHGTYTGFIKLTMIGASPPRRR